MNSERPETGLPCDCGAEVHDDEHDPGCAIWGKAKASQGQTAPPTGQSGADGEGPDPSEGDGARNQEDRGR
jgi:hypothetical protein